MEEHILTIDVEDNFTYEELVYKEDWYKYEGQVVDTTLEILDLIEKFSCTATFFIVGHLARRHPELVKYIVEKGHEIASHSYWHIPLNTLSIDMIEEDIRKSKEILESISGTEIMGYRAMGYSLPQNPQSFFKLLKKYGYRYDSSDKYGHQTILQSSIGLFHVYPSYISILGKKIIFSGGTYLRLLPLYIIKKGIENYTKKGFPVCLYIHPWELNRDQPKREVSLKQKILQSPITFTTKDKLINLMRYYKFTSIKNFLGSFRG